MVWLTGLPAAGKSTLAALVEEALVADGGFAYLLDAHNLRHGLSGDLDFTREARSENARRAGHVARLLADSGTIVIVALISPYADDRSAARRLVEADGIDFLEVFVDTPLDECERRDPKGMYARARAGRLPTMTGVDDPYEPPERPDVRIDTTSLPPVAGAETILAALRERGVVLGRTN